MDSSSKTDSSSNTDGNSNTASSKDLTMKKGSGGEDSSRTTMVVRLHQDRTTGCQLSWRINCNILDTQIRKIERSKKSYFLGIILCIFILPWSAAPNMWIWLAEVNSSYSTASIFGFKISFSFVPKNINIKVIPGQGE